MSRWHAWGDYVHTLDERIGDAKLARHGDDAAGRSAREAGFDVELRTHDGFEPWVAAFESDGGDDDATAFGFAASPIVRGWRRVGP